MTDAELAREIEEALTVDPSPEFVARVRARVRSQPASAPWTIPWVVGAGAAAAVVAVGALVLQGPAPRHDTRPDIVLSSTQPVVVPPETLAPAIIPSQLPTVAPESNPPAAQTVARAAATEPEVLIAPGEAAALRRLLSGPLTRPLDPPTLNSLGGPADVVALQPLKDIVFAPMADMASITIEPLGTAAREEGVRQ